jgi:protein O-GlcNAc transferase
MEPRNRTNNDVLNIGIVSGDFIDHPVSFFINTFLEHHTTNFKVVCYSQSTGSSPKLQENDQYKIIKNVSADDAVKLIKSDDIDILIDLSGHTAANRLDIFAKRAAPVQISYCGYPYTTGLVNMDYRITDKVCDNPNVFDKNYTEKLLFMDNCFLCWGGKIDVELEDNSTDQFIRIGCFNRLNKINDDMIALFNKVLENVHNTLLVFKTKALLNEDVKEKFLEKFNKYKDRVSVLKCTVLHDAHLKVYNQIDVAIDTFPYSGTTTSCEALSVGVPVYTIYNNDTFYHPQNVTTSLLVNSGLDEFVCKDADDIVSRLQTLSLKGLRERIYNSFTYGKVCDKKVYTANFEELLKLNL